MKLKRHFKPPNFVFILMFLGLGAPAFAEAYSSAENIQSRRLIEVLEEMGERYQIFFSYETDILSDVEVDFQFRDEEQIESAINRLLSQTGFDYKAIGAKFIVIYHNTKAGNKKARKIQRKVKQLDKLEQTSSLSLERNNANPLKRAASIFETVAKAQVEKTISGSVKDADGLPLIGATIQVKGASTGTVTDLDGNFSLTVADDVATLVISYTGYTPQEINISGRTSIEVILVESVSILDEIVVVGYGTQGRGRVSAAVTQIEAEDLEIDKRPVTNVQSSLVGSVPGLIINQVSGKLGSPIDIKVRAVSALEDKNALVLIDGFEGSINDINPSDIASVTVLKDAAATAIYGARSANGVVLITTKNTRRNERMSLTYSFNHSRQTPARTAEIVNAEQFIEFSNEAAVNEALRNNPNLTPDEVSLPFTNEELQRARNGFYPDTEWVDELYGENAGQTAHNLTITGGSEKVGYFLNAGYLNQNGLVVGSDNFKRYNLRLKVDADITDWLTVGANASNTLRNTDNVPVIEGNAVRGRPFFPVRLEDGTYVDKGAAGGEPNPLGRARSGSYEREKIDALNLQLYSQLKPLKNLTLEGRVSYTSSNLFNEIWNTPYEYIILDMELQPETGIIPVNDADRNLVFRSDRIYTLNTLSTARYEAHFNQRHHLSVLAGLQTQDGESNYVRAERLNFILPNLQDLKLGQEITGFGNESGRGDNRTTLSYFSRISYDYQGKYLAEFNFRADASSNFGPNNQWGYFPAVSVGWNLGEEAFISNAGFIDVLKLRASWGQNGDDGSINAIESVAFDPSGVGLGGSALPTLFLGDAVNPDLKWETSEKINLGLDFVLWKGKLGLTAEYFTDKRRDIITRLLTSVEGGLGGVLDNVYDAKAWGYELDLSHRGKIGGAVDVFAGLNLTYYDSEITNTEGVRPLNNSETNYQDLGLPVFGNWYGYETDGFFDNQEEIDAYAIDQSAVVAQGDAMGRYLGGFKYVDQNGDGVVNADDRIVLKENTGDNYRIGFNVGASFKGFSLSARVYGVLRGYQWWRGGNSINPFTGDIAPFVYQLDTWRPDTPDATFPSATASNIIPFAQSVSHLIKDNAYLKLKNINLGYTFDQQIIDRLKIINGLTLYVSVENLGVLWTNNPAYDTGWDPELGTGDFRYPIPLTASFGANIKF